MLAELITAHVKTHQLAARGQIQKISYKTETPGMIEIASISWMGMGRRNLPSGHFGNNPISPTWINSHEGVKWVTMEQMVEEFKSGPFGGVGV